MSIEVLIMQQHDTTEELAVSLHALSITRCLVVLLALVLEAFANTALLPPGTPRNCQFTRTVFLMQQECSIPRDGGSQGSLLSCF